MESAMSSESVYIEDITDEEWPRQLMPEEQFYIAKLIFRAPDQRLWRFITGPGGFKVYGTRIPAGRRVWYRGGPLPADFVDHGMDGFDPKFCLWHPEQLRPLASLRRKHMIIEDPAHPAGDVLMLTDRAKDYVGEWLMCCVRVEQQERARFFNLRKSWVSPHQTEPVSEDNPPPPSGRGP
jgi:hypothetical protein